MRNTEERVCAVKRQVKKFEQQKHIRRRRIAGITSIAASLLLIIVFSFALPSIMADFSDGEYALGTTSSIFGGSVSFGYIIMGLLAFVLGVSVTILCYRFRLRDQANLKITEDDDG